MPSIKRAVELAYTGLYVAAIFILCFSAVTSAIFALTHGNNSNLQAIVTFTCLVVIICLQFLRIYHILHLIDDQDSPHMAFVGILDCTPLLRTAERLLRLLLALIVIMAELNVFGTRDAAQMFVTKASAPILSAATAINSTYPNIFGVKLQGITDEVAKYAYVVPIAGLLYVIFMLWDLTVTTAFNNQRKQSTVASHAGSLLQFLGDPNFRRLKYDTKDGAADREASAAGAAVTHGIRYFRSPRFGERLSGLGMAFIALVLLTFNSGIIGAIFMTIFTIFFGKELIQTPYRYLSTPFRDIRDYFRLPAPKKPASPPSPAVRLKPTRPSAPVNDPSDENEVAKTVKGTPRKAPPRRRKSR